MSAPTKLMVIFVVGLLPAACMHHVTPIGRMPREFVWRGPMQPASKFFLPEQELQALGEALSRERGPLLRDVEIILHGPRSHSSVLILETVVFGGPYAEVIYGWSLLFPQSNVRFEDSSILETCLIEQRRWNTITEQLRRLADVKVLPHALIGEWDFYIVLSFYESGIWQYYASINPWGYLALDHPGQCSDEQEVALEFVSILLRIFKQADVASRHRLVYDEFRRSLAHFRADNLDP